MTISEKMLAQLICPSKSYKCQVSWTAQNPVRYYPQVLYILTYLKVLLKQIYNILISY